MRRAGARKAGSLQVIVPDLPGANEFALLEYAQQAGVVVEVEAAPCPRSKRRSLRHMLRGSSAKYDCGLRLLIAEVQGCIAVAIVIAHGR